MSLYIGIDAGGTTVKGGLIDENGALIAEDSVPTVLGDVAQSVALLVNNLTAQANGSKIAGIGIGCAGMIDSDEGKVVFAGNLDLKDYPLAERVKRETGLPVKITNDANAAALGEAKFGAGKHFKDSILVTLGTGVGGGIVIGGKLYEGFKSAGAERCGQAVRRTPFRAKPHFSLPTSTFPQNRLWTGISTVLPAGL